MAWETSLDRLVLRRVHEAEDGAVQDAEIRSILEELLQLGDCRPRTWFHSGYARSLLGLDLPEPQGGPEAKRWYLFGQLKGQLRRSDSGWISDLCDDDRLLLELLVEPAIATQVLPAVMRSYFRDGNFERAVHAIEMMAGHVEETKGDLSLLVEAGLVDLLARIERGHVRREDEGPLRRAIERAMALPHFGELGTVDRARYHRALARSHLSTGEWAEARCSLDKARKLCPDEHPIRRSLDAIASFAALRVFAIDQLAPQEERSERDEALEILGDALAANASNAELVFVRGILRYEQGDFAGACEDFDAAVRQLRNDGDADAELFARARFFLGASLLAAGKREDYRKAARLIEETLDSVEPDLQSFYEVYDALKDVDRKVALSFLDRVDVGRGSSAESVLLVALEYQALGEPQPALEAAQRVLEVATDLDQRLDAFKIQLSAHNMLGQPESARDDYFAIRELLMRRGAFDELERTLQDEDLVGQALDHIETKVELAELYEEMENKEWERAQLKVQVARAFKARKEVEDLKQALGLLQEVGIEYPELASEDLSNLQKLLELRDDAGGPDSAIKSLAAKLGRAPRILVVGGNERQRKHQPRLEKFASEQGFESEWLMANYSSPQKLVGQITDRMSQGIDLLVLLHWNRHETTEPALEKARAAGVPARTVFLRRLYVVADCDRRDGRTPGSGRVRDQVGQSKNGRVKRPGDCARGICAQE